MKRVNNILAASVIVSTLAMSASVFAICTRVSYITSIVRAGKTSTVQIMDNRIQPEGTVIADVTKSVAQIASEAPSAINLETIMYRCDKADADSIYEIFYMPNSGYNISPYGQIYNDFYWTNMPGLVMKFFNDATGQPFSNEIKSRKIESEPDPANSNRIVVRLKHFSGIRNLQIRNNAAVSNGLRSAIGQLSRAVVSLRGPGMNAAMTDGSKTASLGSYAMLVGAENVGGVATTSCGVKMITPSVVNLGSHTMSALSAGLPMTPFSVVLDCQNNAMGVMFGFDAGSDNTIGSAYNEDYVLIKNAGQNKNASGLGVRIYKDGVPLKLIRYTAGSITSTGWYSVGSLSGAVGGYQDVTLDFSARYEKLTGQTVTPGIANTYVTFLINQN